MKRKRHVAEPAAKRSIASFFRLAHVVLKKLTYCDKQYNERFSTINARSKGLRGVTRTMRHPPCAFNEVRVLAVIIYICN